jgi:DME family drug/metabolite transporter
MGPAGGVDVLVFALLPAMLWGVSPILTKRGMDNGGSSLRAAVVVVSVGTATYWLTLLAVSNPLARIGALSTSTVLVFLLSGLFGAVVWFAYNVGVDRVGASVSSAGFNTHPLFATVLALVWLDEALGVLTALGILVLIAGLILIGLSEGGDITGWRAWELVFPLAAGGAYAVSNVVRRFGLTTTPVTTHEAITINSTTTLLVLVAYLLSDGRESVRAPSRSVDAYFAASGLLSAAALFFLFEAFDRGSVAVVSAVSGTSPMFAVAFTYVFLSDIEAVTGRIVAGALLVVLGAVLITLV